MGFMKPNTPKIPKPKPAPEPEKETPTDDREIADPNRAAALEKARKRAKQAATKGKQQFRRDLSEPIGTMESRGGIQIYKPRKRKSVRI